MPKYLEIENILRKRIKDGVYPPGSPFPQQNKLALEFNTSRVTIRKALEHLIKTGLVYTQRGSGTFVRADAQIMTQFNANIDQYVGTTKLLGKNHNIISKIISFGFHYPDKLDMQYLNLKSHDMIYDIHRLRIVDNESYALEYTKMPVKVIPGIDENVLKESIYEYIEKQLHQKIGAAYRKISAAKPSNDDKKYLDCKIDDPVLKVKQVVFLGNDIPFELSETHHRYDKENIMVYLTGHD